MIRYALKQFYYERPEKPIPKSRALITLRTYREIRISRKQDRFNQRFDKFYDCLSIEEKYIYHTKVQDIVLNKVFGIICGEDK